MAMQASMGLSKILLIFGAGYTGTVLMRNGKLSDVLAELQALLKGIEKQGGSGTNEGMTAQIRHLAAEVQRLGSTRQITVLNGTPGQGNITSLIVPAAALGVAGYGYMWWKGLSFSDLMYVTKKSMATAVSNLTKHLESVSEALAETKRHLTQRIENLDGKLDEQVEISKLIKNEVIDVRGDLSQIGNDLDALQKMLSGLDGKIMSLEDKQDLTNMGLYYLINYAEGRKTKIPESLQGELKIMGRSCNRLTSSEVPSLKGLKDIADSLTAGNDRRLITNGNSQENVDILEDPPTSLMRSVPVKG